MQEAQALAALKQGGAAAQQAQDQAQAQAGEADDAGVMALAAAQAAEANTQLRCGQCSACSGILVRLQGGPRAPIPRIGVPGNACWCAGCERAPGCRGCCNALLLLQLPAGPTALPAASCHAVPSRLRPCACAGIHAAVPCGARFGRCGCRQAGRPAGRAGCRLRRRAHSGTPGAGHSSRFCHFSGTVVHDLRAPARWPPQWPQQTGQALLGSRPLSAACMLRSKPGGERAPLDAAPASRHACWSSSD